MQTAQIRKRLQRIGLTYNDASQIAKRVAFQIRAQGSENTARYLKTVGDAVLFHLFGTGSKPAWVHTRHGFPTFLWEARGYPVPVLVRVAKLARVIRLTSATRKQMQKVITGAVGDFKGEISAVQEMTRFVNLGMSRLGLLAGEPPSDEPMLIGRQFSRVMSVSGKVENTSSPPILESFRILKAWPELTALPNWQRVFEPMLPKSVEQVLGAVEPLPRVAGEIHASQEGGAKLRMYASPYTAIQCVMSPVHDWFVAFLRRLPMNCTWNQLLGAENAQARLKDGFVYSLDLSTATCRFPLSVQTDMARELGMPEVYLTAIEAVSRGQWKVGSEIDRRSRYLSWTVGQPLGMRFSMSMFSLAHNLLLAGIASSLGYNPWNSFNVLGDDVVIYHKPISEVYSQIVQLAGVPISWNKSHSSDKIAEFAGATITRDLILRPGQFREAVPKNVLELAEVFGPLVHESSALSLKVQKLHLFNKGLYVPEDMQEYSMLLRANTQSQIAFDDLPDFKLSAPLWSMRVSQEFRDQLAGLGVKVLLAPKYESMLGVFDVIPKTANASFARDMAKSWIKGSRANLPIQSALYWAWLSLYQDLCQGIYDPQEMVRHVNAVLDKLHSFHYLPPRSRSGATKFKRLLAYLLPRGKGLAEAA